MPKIEFSILLAGPEGQRSIALSGTEVLIGRDDKCAVVLAAPSISVGTAGCLDTERTMTGLSKIYTRRTERG